MESYETSETVPNKYYIWNSRGLSIMVYMYVIVVLIFKEC